MSASEWVPGRWKVCLATQRGGSTDDVAGCVTEGHPIRPPDLNHALESHAQSVRSTCTQ